MVTRSTASYLQIVLSQCGQYIGTFAHDEDLVDLSTEPHLNGLSTLTLNDETRRAPASTAEPIRVDTDLINE